MLWMWMQAARRTTAHLRRQRIRSQIPLHRHARLEPWTRARRVAHVSRNVHHVGQINRLRFCSLVGVGYGKAREVPLAISKGVEEAKRNFFRVPRVGSTIPHPVQGEAAAGVVLLRPAAAGTGVIAGGPVRAVLECAGIHDVLSKSLGSSNTINIVHATVAALKQLEEPRAVAARRGLDFDQVAPARLVRAEAEANAAQKVGA